MSERKLINGFDDQLLRINDVAKLTTLSKSCINLWIAQGRFPKPITLSKTVKVWSLRSLRAWTNNLEASTDSKNA
jgi:predicted DNA-binding transcriptional regulator AlpA